MTEEFLEPVTAKKRRRFFPFLRKENHEQLQRGYVSLEHEAKYLLAQAELTNASTKSWFTKFIAFVLTLVIVFILWIVTYPYVFGGEPKGLETVLSLATSFKDIVVLVMKAFE